MPSAGALPAPTITAFCDRYTRTASNTIDTCDFVDISVDAPNLRLYFTTDGSRPTPFKKLIGGQEVTFEYVAPFNLKSGKRVVRAVAVSRDGLLESAVVSKTFHVSDDYVLVDDYNVVSYGLDALDPRWDTPVKSRIQTKWRQSPLTRRPVTAVDWIACTRRYPYDQPLVDEEDLYDASLRMPGSVFRPANYAATQVNMWAFPPGDVRSSRTGLITYGNHTGTARYRTLPYV